MSMNLKRLYDFWKERKNALPGSEFKKSLWNRLSSVFDVKYGSVAGARGFVSLKWVSVGVASILVAGSFGTGVYAYNSPEVTEGSVLFPVKTALEKVEELVKTNPVDKAEFYLKTLEKREKEMKTIVDKESDKGVENNINLTQDRVESIEEKLQSLVDLLAEDDGSEEIMGLLEKIQERLEKKLEKKQEWLEKAQERLDKIQEKKDHDEEEGKEDQEMKDNEEEKDSHKEREMRKKKDHDEDEDKEEEMKDEEEKDSHKEREMRKKKDHDEDKEEEMKDEEEKEAKLDDADVVTEILNKLDLETSSDDTKINSEEEENEELEA